MLKVVDQSSLYPINSTSTVAEIGEPGKQCRICLENQSDSGEEIRAPCKCQGSVKYIHVNCLKKWVLTVLRDKPPRELLLLEKQGIPCELCHQKIYFELEDIMGCRECSQVHKKIKIYLGKFILITLAIILFICSAVVLAIQSMNYSNTLAPYLIVLSMASLMGIVAGMLLVYLVFQFLIYQDIDITKFQTVMMNRRRNLGTTTDNWRKRVDNPSVQIQNIQ